MTHPSPLSEAAICTAAENLRDVLSLAIQHDPGTSAVVVWDGDSELSLALTEAYRRALPSALFVEFPSDTPEQVLESFAALQAGDLVVLIQSTSFRLNAFRIRIELFRRSLKVVEHPHLSRMPGAQGLVYLDALAYDRDYFHGVGHALKERIDRAQIARLETGAEALIYSAALEPAKLNIGDYSQLKNVGGQYPIGEVFTESRDLEAVQGQVRIAFFGDTSYRVNQPAEPITLVVDRGRVVECLDSTGDFDLVLEKIRADEGEVWLRELGLGMNRAFTPNRVVSDIGSFERMCGVHLSLGAKHVTYRKPNIKKKAARYHVDVFAATEALFLDDEQVFGAGKWLVGQ